MRHLVDDELVALVFRTHRCGREANEASVPRAHLESCAECRAKFDDLRAAVLLLQDAAMESPPPRGWVNLEARIDVQTALTQTRREPPWIRVVAAHVGGIFFAVLLILSAGSRLESASIWESINLWPIFGHLGASGVAALVFFGGGSLVTLAFAPVLWWESRRSGRD